MTQAANSNTKNDKSPMKIKLSMEKCAGHGDHWSLLSNNISEDIPNWLQKMVERATIPQGLSINPNANTVNTGKTPSMLISTNEDLHINQILALKDNKPTNLMNAYPCVNSPYGITAKIDRVIVCEDTLDAVLRIKSEDGTIVYGFDQLYAVNQNLYEEDQDYFINLSAWVYRIKTSDTNEVITIEDQETIRYHRAYNDIVAANNGNVPEDIQKLIEEWQPSEILEDGKLAPIEINMANMCAYLFGETLGQEDDAWCQGEVIGKQSAKFEGLDVTLFDVVILREAKVKPLVVRMAAVTTEEIDSIQVKDFIQANIWMQASIYSENQN